MSFNTKGQDVNTGDSKSLPYGNVYAHIHSASLGVSQRTGKKALNIILEGPAVGGDFEGFPIDKNNPEGLKFKGKVAWLTVTSWLDAEAYNSNDLGKNEIMNRMVYIAKELGVKDQLDNINADTLEEWVEKATDLVKGENMHFLITASEEEYEGKTRIKKNLARFKFCSLNEDKVEKFDKNNRYHYRALQKAENVDGFEPAKQDSEFDFS